MRLLDLAGAVIVAEAWREQGFRKIGFANGCFDILHAGHVAMLEEARSKCDRLMVALNTDNSVSALKGPERPINGLLARSDVVGALRCVDAVVMFAEETPVNLIEAIRPTVLVKGDEYEIDQIVGADLIRVWGGEVLRVGMSHGTSTTKIIQRIFDKRAGD